MRHFSRMVLATLLVSACAPTLHRSVPARADALQCAAGQLQSRGFAVSATPTAVRAERAVEQEWVFRVDHVVQATLQRADSRLVLRGARIETRTPGNDLAPSADRVFHPSERRLDPDAQLTSVVDDVGRACQALTAMLVPR